MRGFGNFRWWVLAEATYEPLRRLEEQTLEVALGERGSGGLLGVLGRNGGRDIGRLRH